MVIHCTCENQHARTNANTIDSQPCSFSSEQPADCHCGCDVAPDTVDFKAAPVDLAWCRPSLLFPFVFAVTIEEAFDHVKGACVYFASNRDFKSAPNAIARNPAHDRRLAPR